MGLVAAALDDAVVGVSQIAACEGEKRLPSRLLVRTGQTAPTCRCSKLPCRNTDDADSVSDVHRRCDSASGKPPNLALKKRAWVVFSQVRGGQKKKKEGAGEFFRSTKKGDRSVTIIRARNRENTVLIRNRLLEDESLSAAVIGTLVYLHAYPEASHKDLMRRFNIGRDKAHACLKAAKSYLAIHGY